MEASKKSQLEKILNQKIISIQKLSGGSGDIVNLLSTQDHLNYIFKSGTRNSISSQVTFYQNYPDLALLPKLIYSNQDRTELLISFIEGEKSREQYNKDYMLEQLTDNFITKYAEINSPAYGFISGFIQGNSFAEFLSKQAEEAYSYVQDLFSIQVLAQVLEIITSSYRNDLFEKPYLIHGDLGFHNFFYTKDQLLGIIDPDPIVGHPLYDLMYAFCSTPEQINTKNLDALLHTLNKYFPLDVSKKNEYLIIALFKRISSSRKHHPHDLAKYMKIWESLHKK